MFPSTISPESPPGEPRLLWGAVRDGKMYTPFGWRRVPSSSGALDAYTPLGLPYPNWTSMVTEGMRYPGTYFTQDVEGVPRDVGRVSGGKLVAFRSGGTATWRVEGGRAVPDSPNASPTVVDARRPSVPTSAPPSPARRPVAAPERTPKRTPKPSAPTSTPVGTLGPVVLHSTSEPSHVATETGAEAPAPTSDPTAAEKVVDAIAGKAGVSRGVVLLGALGVAAVLAFR